MSRYIKWQLFLSCLVFVFFFASCNAKYKEKQDFENENSNIDISVKNNVDENNNAQNDSLEEKEDDSRPNTIEEIKTPKTPIQIELEEMLLKDDIKQILLVRQDDEIEYKAKCIGYEYIDDRFLETLPVFDVVIGRLGIGKEMEGDKKAPSGMFEIPFAFGMEDIADSLKLPYVLTTPTHYWVDDVESEDYNDMRQTDENPKELWKSYEKLYIEPYRYAFVIDYNSLDEKGLGSAIFFHIWQDEEHGTSGCTATDIEKMKEILYWLKGYKNPHILQGSGEDYDNWFSSAIKGAFDD